MELPLPMLVGLNLPALTIHPAKKQKTHKTDTVANNNNPEALRLQPIRQVEAADLPEKTKALLVKLSAAQTFVQFKRCLKNYEGDFKDFNAYYKCLLEHLYRTVGARKRKLEQRETEDYDANTYNNAHDHLALILKNLKDNAAASSYSAYYSILQDQTINLKHREWILHYIEPCEVKFRILKALKAAGSGFGINQNVIDHKLESFWLGLDVQPQPSLVVEDLLYIFLSTDTDRLMEAVQSLMRRHGLNSEEKMDWNGLALCTSSIDLIFRKFNKNYEDFNAYFFKLAKEDKLCLETRVCALYFVFCDKNSVDLMGICLKELTQKNALEYFSVFLRLGYELKVRDYVNQSPDMIELGSFERFYSTVLIGLEALEAFYQEKIKYLQELGGHEEDLEYYSQLWKAIPESKDYIQSTYPLYKIILQKRAERCELASILEAKKASLTSRLDEGFWVYLNEKAYALPSAFDPEYKEGYEDMTFNFFMEKLGTAIGKTPTQLNVYDDWRQVLEGSIVRSLLDAQEADDSVYVLKLTAVAAGIIQLFEHGSYEKAQSLMNALVFNLKTCYGGQLQAIDYTYGLLMNEHYQSIDDPQERALNIVLNSLYVIRKNWVMEDEVRYTELGKMVKYSPEVADGVFMNALETYLDQKGLMALYGGDKESLNEYYFLTGRDVQGDNFSRTHIGNDIMGIAGIELGLVPQDKRAVFDKNIEAGNWFLKNTVSDKASIVSAFVESFTFENVWPALAELIWKKAAEASSFGRLVYKDPACTQTLNLDIYEDYEGILARQDPLAKGIVRFLDQLGLNPDMCCETMDVYYKDPLYEEIDSICIYTRLSKRGVALILEKLGLLTVEAKA